MHALTLQYLRDHPETWLEEAEGGDVAVVEENGRPLFMMLPLQKQPSTFAIAAALYAQGVLSGLAAGRLCGMDRFAFYQSLSDAGLSVVDYSAEEWAEELQLVQQLHG
jgi:predicted HTH domain antitoxin